jgi:hypothetical protein
MLFSAFPCYLVPLRPKYSPQHPILKHPNLRSSLSMSDQVIKYNTLLLKHLLGYIDVTDVYYTVNT